MLKVRISVQIWHWFVTHYCTLLTRLCVTNKAIFNHIITDIHFCRLPFMWDLNVNVLSFSCFLPYPSLHFSFCVSSVWFWLWLRYLAPVAVGPFDWAVEGWRRSPARALGTDWFCRCQGRSRRSPALTDRQLSSAGDAISTFFILESQKNDFSWKGTSMLYRGVRVTDISTSANQTDDFGINLTFGIQYFCLNTADVRYMWRWKNFRITDICLIKDQTLRISNITPLLSSK